MALTQISTGGIKDDAVTDAKLPTNSVGNSEMKDDAVGVAELSATGTASSSTFLRGDNSWVTPTDTNTQLAFANDANNRVITGTGSGLNGEANLTFDGGALSQTIDANDEGINITAAGAHAARFKVDSNQTGANDTIFFLSGRWNTSEVASIHFRTGADTTNKDDGYISFYTRNSGSALAESLRIRPSGDVSINQGDLFFEGAGKGICLGVTANTDANTLDDYEEGTWTPTSSQGGWTFSNQYAKYTKIGRTVYVQCYISISGSGNGSALIMGGLPFTSANYAVGSVDFGNGGVKGTYARSEINTSTIEFMYPSENTSTARSSLAGDQIGDSYIILSLEYQV